MTSTTTVIDLSHVSRTAQLIAGALDLTSGCRLTQLTRLSPMDVLGYVSPIGLRGMTKVQAELAALGLPETTHAEQTRSSALWAFLNVELLPRDPAQEGMVPWGWRLDHATFALNKIKRLTRDFAVADLPAMQERADGAARRSSVLAELGRTWADFLMFIAELRVIMRMAQSQLEEALVQTEVGGPLA